jgi:para-aminobenzoate synthetase component 1
MTIPYRTKKGSVQVTELCGIYSFMQVHQMISTVTSKLDYQYGAVDAISLSRKYDRAPKISAMKIIEDFGRKTKEDCTVEQWVTLRPVEI